MTVAEKGRRRVKGGKSMSRPIPLRLTKASGLIASKFREKSS